MGQRVAVFLVAAVAGFSGLSGNTAFGDVIITLEAFLESGAPVSGPVAAGTNVVVDVLLSVDAEDDPLPHVRMIQFDFQDSSPQVQLDAFTWMVDANAYSFQDPDFPLTNVTSIYISAGPGILTLTTQPVQVASVDVTINGGGTLDVVNPDNSDANAGAEIRARFDAPGRFSALLGNLQGGDLDFSVTGGGGSDPEDQDGDGVPNDEDAFPDDPDEDTDTNEDGVGDNADPDDDGDGAEDEVDDFPVDPDEDTDTDGDDVGNNGDPDDDNDGVEDADDEAPLDPDESDGDGGDNGGGGPRMCGAGMIGPSLLLFLGLSWMTLRPRMRRCCA